MNGMLWAGQALLAVAFGYSGAMKSSQPIRRLVAAGQTGVDGLPLRFVRFIGVSELLGVVGLLAPCGTKIAPILTPIAALALGSIMIPAAVIHSRRGEPKAVALNLVLLTISATVAVGRLTLP
jgi:hypothetical protein